MIEVFGCGSPNVFKVLAMLEEVDVPYRFRNIQVYAGEQYSAEFLQKNPNGKVPVIVDSDGPAGAPHTVFESGAILIYLAEKSGRLLPSDAVVRSSTLQWLMFQMASVGPTFGQALHFKYIAPQGLDYARARFQLEVERLYDVIEARLSAVAYLAGNEYTIADVAAFPWIGRYVKTLGVDLAGRAHVRAWIERIESRPAQRRVAPICKELFKASLDAQAAARPEDLDRFFGRSRHARNAG